MNIKYFIISISLLMIFMRLTYTHLVQFTEVSSYLWYEAGQKRINNSAEILVLGDSQLLSGIDASVISEIESVPKESILFLVRPSEQPEGMLDQYLIWKSSLPKLKKIYLNLSPISISKNSVTDAHKELYYSFGDFHIHQLTDIELRKAYFSNGSDFFWKLMIEIFPYFGLNQNYSSALGIVINPTANLEDSIEVNGNQLRKMPSMSILERRKKNNRFLKQHLQKNETWTWKNYGVEHVLSEKDNIPQGSSQVFKVKRTLSISIIQKLIEMAKSDQLKIICLDLPFSPSLEKDIKLNHVRNTLNEEMNKFNFDRMIRVDSNTLDRSDYFTDFTHLNSKGRDALKSYLVKIKQ